MKKSGFREGQIAFAIKQHELGTRVEARFRKMGTLARTDLTTEIAGAAAGFSHPQAEFII